MFAENTDEVLRRKVEERVKEGVHPKLSREELLEARKHWCRAMPKERKFKRSLAFFTRQPDASLGDILSWGWIPELKVYAIRRKSGVQYLQHLIYIKTLSWWDVQELCQTKCFNYLIRWDEQICDG
ncbi:hypothetical protein Hanom_Chr03g00207501 [Helianthus anomalus]